MGLTEFMDYCEKNSGVRTGLESSAHERLVNAVFMNPGGLLGLRNIKRRYKDVGLSGDEGLITAIDVVLSDEDEVYICEVKTTKRRNRGQRTQLMRQYSSIRKEFGILPIRISLWKQENGKIKIERQEPTIKDSLDSRYNCQKF